MRTTTLELDRGYCQGGPTEAVQCPRAARRTAHKPILNSKMVLFTVNSSPPVNRPRVSMAALVIVTRNAREIELTGVAALNSFE